VFGSPFKNISRNTFLFNLVVLSRERPGESPLGFEFFSFLVTALLCVSFKILQGMGVQQVFPNSLSDLFIRGFLLFCISGASTHSFFMQRSVPLWIKRLKSSLELIFIPTTSFKAAPVSSTHLPSKFHKENLRAHLLLSYSFPTWRTLISPHTVISHSVHSLSCWR